MVAIEGVVVDFNLKLFCPFKKKPRNKRFILFKSGYFVAKVSPVCLSTKFNHFRQFREERDNCLKTSHFVL